MMVGVVPLWKEFLSPIVEMLGLVLAVILSKVIKDLCIIRMKYFVYRDCRYNLNL